MNAAFATLHHIAAFALVGSLFVEFALIREAISVTIARKLQITDAIFGASASIVLIAGLARVFYFEKGTDYYFSNGPFWAKMVLFIIVGCLSVYPTKEFLSWRQATKLGHTPEVAPGKVPKLRLVISLEIITMALLIFCAALMARGVGSF